MTGLVPPPITGFASNDFSLRRARWDIEEGCASIHDFAIRFLASDRGRNPNLVTYLNKRAKFWLGPIEINLSNLERIAGPGKQYHEDEDKWEIRIGRIQKGLKELDQLPPLIAGLKDSISGADNQSGILTIVDGAHRLEAIQRQGHKTAWVLAFFIDANSRYTFLTEYNRGLYNVNFKRIGPGESGPAKLPAVPRTKPAGPPKLHSHYKRGMAQKYDQSRESQPHWHSEYEAVGQMLSSLKGASILDAPFGTGRFIPLYKEMGCTVFGADISKDMLAQARLKADQFKLDQINFIEGNIETTEFGKVDASVCVRFLNLVPPEVAERVVKNLARASRKQLILHLGSVDEAAIPADQRDYVIHSLDQSHEVQRHDMKYAPHKLSAFLEWCMSAGFYLAESIETQKTGSNYSRVHMHRLVR